MGGIPSRSVAVQANTDAFMTKDPVISDPTQGRRDGPTKDSDPGDSHSGEGLASVRPRLARTLADSAQRSATRQLDARTPLEPAPEQQAPDTPSP
jgi:hypothetical protein